MKQVFLLITLMITFSCGKVINSRSEHEAFSRDISFALMEHQCVVNPNGTSKIFRNISELYQKALSNSRSIFWGKSSPVLFGFSNPLVVSLASLQEEYNQMATNPAMFDMDQISLLYNKAQRFEDLRCVFGLLAEKKSNDLRPYFNVQNFCAIDADKKKCSESDISTNSYLKKSVLELCQTFYTEARCQAEFRSSQLSSNLTNYIEKYQTKFASEKYNPLFQMRSDNLRFNCQQDEELTIVKIPIFSSGIAKEQLQEMLLEVENTWTNETFKINFEILPAPTSSSVQIIPINTGISHVPNENASLIYLNNTLPAKVMAKVLAHELGHVLGFPDCYIEFFDKSKKELVYYELSETNMNIMCSMKESVKVPVDYFKQIKQRSCNFRSK